MTPQQPEHVEGEEFENAPPGDNPIAGSLEVLVSVPEQISARLVDASTLGDYEMWLFLGSFLSNLAVGFGVAAFQTAFERVYVVNTPVFIVLSLACVMMAFVKRKRLRSKSRDVVFKAR